MNFELENTTEIKKYLNYLHKKGIKVISISEVKETRKVRANNLYWEWLEIIHNETGNDKSYLHEFFKYKFLKKENLIGGFGKVEKRITTTDLTTKDFAEYMQKIDRLAVEFLNIHLPRPESDITKLYI